MEQSGSLVMIVAMLALMYFMVMRPENKRKKEAQQLRDGLRKGDQITTIGGIVGRIVMVAEENIVIETSDDRVRMEIAKWAVSTNNSRKPEETTKKPVGLGSKKKSEESSENK